MLKYSLAAVALIASGTFAIAEPGDKGGTAGAGPGAAIEHSPGSGAAGSAPGRDAGPGSSAGSASEKSKDAPEGKMAPGRTSERDMKPGSAKGADAASPKALDSNKRADDQKSDRTRRAADEQQPGKSSKTADQDRDHKSNGDKMGAESSKNGSSTGASQGTEGREDGRRSVSVTSEQRTKIAPIFSRHRVDPARNLNVSINIGVALPRSVRVYPVPVEIVEIVPEYRGYDYILLEDNRVAIIDPATYEIIDIIVVA